MGIFSFLGNKIISVSILAPVAKFVNLKRKGRAWLYTYAFTDRLYTTGLPSFIDAPKETADLIKQMKKKAKVKTKKVVAGLPIASVFNSVVVVPKGSDKEIRLAIQGQVKKLIPVPIEEMVLDYKILTPTKDTLPQKSASGEGVQSRLSKTTPVLVTGASKTMVRKYATLFGQTGLDLVSLETEAFALVRSLIGKDKAVSMIVDVGTVRTILLLLITVFLI